MFRWTLFLATFLAFSSARAEQTRLRTEHFSFTVDSNRIAMAQELSEIAEVTLTEVAQQLGVGSSDSAAEIFAPITVRIVHTDAEFVEAMPNQRNIEWAAGVAFPTHGIVVLRIDERTRFGIHDVFRHELSHIVLGRAVHHADLPHWFIEGVAVHQAGEQIRERWQRSADATLTESLPPMVRLRDGFPADGTSADFAYAQSTAFLSFLIERAGWPGVRSVVAKVRAGQPFDQAFDGAYGHPLTEVEGEFRERIAKSASWLPIILGSSVMTAVAGILFLGLAWQRRRRSRRRMATWPEPYDDEFA